MAVNVLDAVVERRAENRSRTPRYIFPTFRSLRHGVPAATNADRNRDAAIVSRSDADRALFETWGWG
jgi:hypothetical protein